MELWQSLSQAPLIIHPWAEIHGVHGDGIKHEDDYDYDNQTKLVCE